MRRLKLFFGIWALFGFIFARIDSAELGEFADLIKEKERRFEARFPASKIPKIVIAGGSNALWGIDSATLSELSGKPVINLAIPAEGGDPYLMHEIALAMAQPDDIIVYTSLNFWIDVGIDKQRAFRIGQRLGLDSYTNGEHTISWIQKLEFYWKPFPTELNPTKEVRRLFSPSPYEHFYNNLNSFGDYAGCTPAAVSPFSETSEGNNKRFATDFKNFKMHAKAKGVRVINVAPWILVKPEEKNDWTNYYWKTLREITGRSDPKGHPDLVLRTDSKEFCDSNAHLSRAMAKKRVESHVIVRLHELLPANRSPSQTP